MNRTIRISLSVALALGVLGSLPAAGQERPQQRPRQRQPEQERERQPQRQQERQREHAPERRRGRPPPWRLLRRRLLLPRQLHPIATAAAVTATAMVTSAIIGSIVNTVPSGCSTVVVNGFAYQQCGSTWYQPQIAGSSTTYIVVNPPR